MGSKEGASGANIRKGRQPRARGIAVTASEAPEAPIGPLLSAALDGLQSPGRATGMARVALDLAVTEAEENPILPVALTLPPMDPEPGETWPHYKERVRNALGPIRKWLLANAGLRADELIAGNALRTRGLIGQIREAARLSGLRLVELDPATICTLMDDAVRDVELPLFRLSHPNLDGRGVRVAVLDSGVDTLHPWLDVAESVSTCGEGTDIPGLHGTHVAGSIASRDSVYQGIAPGVTLLNIKVMDSLGSSQPSFISGGIDEALDRGAEVLSMSLGFNHLPRWSDRGHGWLCRDGRCQLCTAVNNAVQLDGALVVVAAGNEHQRASFLRNNGLADSFDSEVACPGSANHSITVGALTKQTFLTAPFSSRGPTSFGSSKPNIAAPGVNITSSKPAARAAGGGIVPGLTRSDLSETLGGTSMATPIVAGTVALILQRRREAGEDTSPAAVRHELLTQGFKHLTRPADEVGVGRLSLAGL